MTGLGLIITESPDVVENTKLFVGFDGNEAVILPLSDESATWLAWF